MITLSAVPPHVSEDRDRFVGLCRRLAAARGLPRDDARRSMLAEALPAAGLEVAVLLHGDPEGAPRVVAAVSAGAAESPLLPGDRLSGPEWLDDLGAVTIAHRPLPAAEELVLFARDERALDEAAHLALDVVAHFLALPDDRHSPARLRAHLAAAIQTRDLTGNGISVARGWLDHLAAGGLDEDTRDQALDAARRRLLDVQAAVDAFIDATTRALVTDSSSGRADLRAAWRLTATTPLVTLPPTDGADALQVSGHQAALEAFIAAATTLLVPEATILADRVRLPVIDAARLDDEARASLSASLGELVIGVGEAHVAWRLPREPGVSAGRPARQPTCQT